MKIIGLSGAWDLFCDNESSIQGNLPGCNYLDYMKNGMPDPFFGENELEAKNLCRHTYRYEREFWLDEEVFDCRHIELIADGIDTICEISVNGRTAAKTDNINRRYAVDIKTLCKKGQNQIQLVFHDPFVYIENRQKVFPLPKSSTPFTGIGHIRKTPCHFGWDWGPNLPPVGVTRQIAIAVYDVKIDEVTVKQVHNPDHTVDLYVNAALSGGSAEGKKILFTLKDPGGKTCVSQTEAIYEHAAIHTHIDTPQIWWCNGLGKQPLYTLDVSLLVNNDCIDKVVKKIGLRSISLNTDKDPFGENFQFVLNGIPIFAKGADWIPTDSFVQRTDRETVFYYVQAAKEANMNMLRVWGGGTFESEDFYDACDECGILVWQDFLFACNVYPFSDKLFLDNIHAEIRDNVKRIRHRASLALWCGNNEAEATLMFMKDNDPLKISNINFYHSVLPAWLKELDSTTPYWPGSPSSGHAGHKLQCMKKGRIEGDSHLWHIWHGMQNSENLGRFPTRFCSEYGLESMPDIATVHQFHPADNPQIRDSIMTLHQKSASGNEKMLYYLTENYRNPKSFKDFIYITQLSQARAICGATDAWRRNKITSGALFWQLNDCYPVASWSAIDYCRRKKAVCYLVKDANAPVAVSLNAKKREIYAVSDLPEAAAASLAWEIADFGGNVLYSRKETFQIQALDVKKIVSLPPVKNRRNLYLSVRLTTDCGYSCNRTYLLTKDKYARLPCPQIHRKIARENGVNYLCLRSDSFARSVYLTSPCISVHDNYFDLLPGEEKRIRFDFLRNISDDAAANSLTIVTLADVAPKGSLINDKLERLRIGLRKGNIISRIAFKLLL